MKTPQIPARPGMSPLGLCRCGHGRDACAHSGCEAQDRKTVAERQWQKGKLAPAPQEACDIGLFGDAANQTDLIDMLRNPTARKP